MVELDTLPITSSKKRITAFVIDDLMVAFLFLVIFYDQLAAIISPAIGGVSTEDMSLIESQLNQFSVDNLFIMLCIKILYHTVPVWQNGVTFGKYIMKIRVININDGYNPSFTQAFLRAVLRIASEVFFYLGFIMALFTPLQQTLHDKFSSCVVIDA